MMMSRSTLGFSLSRLLSRTFVFLCIHSAAAAEPNRITPHVTVQIGAVNGVEIDDGSGKLAAVYRPVEHSRAAVDVLLLTHHRRDVLASVPSKTTPPSRIAAPAAEKDWIADPASFWSKYPTARFHDYACKTSKIVTQPIPVTQWVQPGDTVSLNSLPLRVFDAAGYTAGSVGYLVDIDGKRIAFTGDLIYSGGRLLDLYSFQEGIPSAEIRGYHGYAGRLGELVSSLHRLAELKPDIVVPARGPVITDPQGDIARLLDRVEQLYANYLSTNALHWYFREERMKKCAARVLPTTDNLRLMPFAHHEKAPEWVIENATSRLIVSDSGRAFLIDCGYDRVIEAVQKMIDSGLIQGVDGIFVTHYHDDHTDRVQAASEKFQCPVYAVAEYADILSRPSAYRMPAMTEFPIQNLKTIPDGHSMKWNEYELTFYFYPGQAIYHGALLARRPTEPPIFFIGDSFAPSGMDDYCLLNRNLVGPGRGYNLCLAKLRAFPESMRLVNEHIPYVFQFTADELNDMTQRYEARTRILQELFPWDSPDYGVDEQWATFYPYEWKRQATKNSNSIDANAAEVPISIDTSVRIHNHSPRPREFVIKINLPPVFTTEQVEKKITLAPQVSTEVSFRLKSTAGQGTHVLTADILSDGMEFHEFIEGLITLP